MTKFTYDDIVMAKQGAAAELRPGERAWIIAVLEDRRKVPLSQFPPGVVYTMEFEDGAAVNVHEGDLELVEKRDSAQ
jgi:hypothetical protein